MTPPLAGQSGQGLRVFAYGGGVQSTAALVLAAQGRINFRTFLFSNVGDDSEDPQTLAYVEHVAKPYAKIHGLDLHELHRVKRDGTRETVHGRITRPGSRSMTIPVRLTNGKPGSRSCTADFKVRVIGKWLKDHGASADNPAVVGQGISLDEISRINARKAEPYELLAYPLVGFPATEDAGLRLRRDDCERVIISEPLPPEMVEPLKAVFDLLPPVTRHDLLTFNFTRMPRPPKSACWFCPFHRALLDHVPVSGCSALRYARSAAVMITLAPRPVSCMRASSSGHMSAGTRYPIGSRLCRSPGRFATLAIVLVHLPGLSLLAGPAGGAADDRVELRLGHGACAVTACRVRQLRVGGQHLGGEVGGRVVVLNFSAADPLDGVGYVGDQCAVHVTPPSAADAVAVADGDNAAGTAARPVAGPRLNPGAPAASRVVHDRVAESFGVGDFAFQVSARTVLLRAVKQKGGHLAGESHAGQRLECFCLRHVLFLLLACVRGRGGQRRLHTGVEQDFADCRRVVAGDVGVAVAAHVRCGPVDRFGGGGAGVDGLVAADDRGADVQAEGPRRVSGAHFGVLSLGGIATIAGGNTTCQAGDAQ